MNAVASQINCMQYESNNTHCSPKGVKISPVDITCCTTSFYELGVLGMPSLKKTVLTTKVKSNPKAHAVKLACWAKLTLLLKFMAVGSHSIHKLKSSDCRHELDYHGHNLMLACLVKLEASLKVNSRLQAKHSIASQAPRKLSTNVSAALLHQGPPM